MTENIENADLNVEVPVEMTAGEMLRNARTTGRRKREIPTISKQLCIREEFLEALENGDYKAIPEPVYILGFARNYAMELGLDPDEIVAKIKKEMGLSSDCAKDDDDDATACAMPSIKEESWSKVAFGKAYQFVYQNWIWFAGGLVAIALVVFAVVMLKPADVDEGQTPEQVVVSVEDMVKEPEYNYPVRERFGTDNRAVAKIILQANKKTGEAGTWVEIKDARGRTELSRVLMPGDVYYVPVKGVYKATFGNAGGVDVWVNGTLVPQIGQDYKKVSDIELSPDALIKNTMK
ncbi:MAG: helix-turn-helix domain-containing protein [Alphaproteobacteria bacterium]|nr:helix-turn-helix domain-containing protein [Alphaproteobacteria bacterium]